MFQRGLLIPQSFEKQSVTQSLRGLQVWSVLCGINRGKNKNLDFDFKEGYQNLVEDTLEQQHAIYTTK